MAEIWPAALPQKPLFGANEPFADNRITFTPDVGDPVMRRRSTLAGGETTYEMDLTEAQAQTFKSFYKTTLFGGLKSFSGLSTPLGEAVIFKIMDFDLTAATRAVRGWRLSMKLRVVSE